MKAQVKHHIKNVKFLEDATNLKFSEDFLNNGEKYTINELKVICLKYNSSEDPEKNLTGNDAIRKFLDFIEKLEKAKIA